jgi:hypothetical protein
MICLHTGLIEVELGKDNQCVMYDDIQNSNLILFEPCCHVVNVDLLPDASIYTQSAKLGAVKELQLLLFFNNLFYHLKVFLQVFGNFVFVDTSPPLINLDLSFLSVFRI